MLEVRLTGNGAYFPNRDAVYKIGVDYLLNNVATLHFQLITSIFDTIFMFLGSRQPRKHVIYVLLFLNLELSVLIQVAQKAWAGVD